MNATVLTGEDIDALVRAAFRRGRDEAAKAYDATIADAQEPARGDGVQEALTDWWLDLRDDFRQHDCAAACVRFAHRVGLLTKEQEELWLRRLTTCPGHDDCGGRSWCAFCGDLKPELLDDAPGKDGAK